MDNLAHTLCGAALAKTRLGKQSPLAFASLVIGANLPDVDALVSMFGGKAAYLVHHRGITHSLLGIAVETVLLAAGTRLGEQWLQRRAARARESNQPTPPAPSWRVHLQLAFIGLMSHVALDALNNYGVRPFLPFSSARYYADLIFIVDPLLWLIFGAMAALAGRRTLRGHATWGLIAVTVTWFLYTHPRTPEHLKQYWPFALLFVIGLRLLGVGRERARPVLVTGSCLLAIYLVGLEISARLAWRNVLRVQTPPSARISAFIDEPWQLAMRSPIVARPFRWSFFLQGERWYYVRDVDVSGRVLGFRRIGPRNLDDPRVREAMRRPEAFAWRYFARLPWAWSEEQGDRSLVGLTDARYQFERGPSWCSIEVELPPAADARPGASEPALGNTRGR